jgi:tetratricopeptide (TPR) repeat protein
MMEGLNMVRFRHYVLFVVLIMICLFLSASCSPRNTQEKYNTAVIQTASPSAGVSSPVEHTNGISPDIIKGQEYMQQFKPKEALGYFEKASAADPDNCDNYVYMASACLMMRDFEKASEYTKKALKINPDFMQAYLVMGNIYLEQSKNEQALEMFDKALHLEPENHNILYEKSRVLTAMGRFKEAAAELEKSEMSSRNKFLYYFQEALILRMQHKNKEAEKSFRQAIQYEPDNPNAFFDLGNCYLDEDKNKEALQCFYKAEALLGVVKKRDVKQSFLYHGLDRKAISLSKLSGYLGESDFDNVVKEYDRFRQLGGESWIATHNTGTAYWLGDKHDKAKIIFKQWLEKGYDKVLTPDLYAYTGEAYLLTGHPDTALDYFRKALAVQPDNEEIIFDFGYYYYTMKDYGKAKYYLKKAIKMGLDENLRIYAYKILKRMP